MDKCPKCGSQIDWTTIRDEDDRTGVMWFCTVCNWEKDIWDKKSRGSRFVGEGLNGITLRKEAHNGTSTTTDKG